MKTYTIERTKNGALDYFLFSKNGGPRLRHEWVPHKAHTNRMSPGEAYALALIFRQQDDAASYNVVER
jgi:hypothetical protein